MKQATLLERTLLFTMLLMLPFVRTAAFGVRTTRTRASSSWLQLRKSSSSSTDTTSPAIVPITLLSGFLGTGKTSALQHLLENKDDLKIGVIVNDFAEVNIDSKLVKASSSANTISRDGGGVIELQNGCACCSLSDELFFSVEKLVTGRKLDAIVVELSGVADPAAIRYNWGAGAPATIKRMAELARVVTLVDAGTFGTNYMTWDMASERGNWVAAGDDCTGNRKVSELLAEQVEAANLVLVNKVDLASRQETEVATVVARALNAKADIRRVEYGHIDPKVLVASSSSSMQQQVIDDTDASHEHSHSEHSCEDPTCTDPSHDHAAAAAAVENSCDDPECTDETHSHSHGHNDHVAARSSTRAHELGIKNFVYKANRPFNAARLMKVLNQWPVPIKDTLDLGVLKDAYQQEYESAGRPLVEDNPFIGVLRSKGFCWFAPSKWSGANQDAWRHDTAMYWSQSGRHFGVSSAGKWWGALPDRKMKQYFVDDQAEYDRIKREDFKTEEFADRRQEIVFIGTKLKQGEITAVLNSCLVTNREMDEYRQKLANFMNELYSTPPSFSRGGAPSGGLFDVGGVDHTNL